MRKTSTYARKRRATSAWDRERHRHVNPVKEALIVAGIREDVERLRTGAALHAYTGANAQALANLAGRLVYVTCHAARLHGLGESPEARILAGTANALADLAQDPDSIEAQRGTIVSGLAAIDRLMPSLHPLSMAAGALELDQLLAQTGSMGTNDVRKALGMAA
jgi:hypothetical protein